jgi:predicted P-loop ATPase
MNKNDNIFDLPQINSDEIEDVSLVQSLESEIAGTNEGDDGVRAITLIPSSQLLDLNIKPGKGVRDWKALIHSGSLGFVRWDEFLLANVVDRDGSRLILTDEETTRLLHGCEAQGCSNIGRKKFEQYLKLVAKDNPCDSAKEMLASLPAWDGTHRIDDFLPTYLGTQNGQYERSIGPYWFTAMVARILEAGCKADFVPILVGGFSKGKSTFLRNVVPSQNFWTEACLTDPIRLVTQKVIGRILVVWEELAGIKSKADVDKVKAFITNPVIELNSRDHRGMDRHGRRFILAGTSSKKHFLRDTDGYGRYLPFEIGKIDLELLRNDILQLWAEALHLVRQRQSACLSLVDYGAVSQLVKYEYHKYIYNSNVKYDVFYDNRKEYQKIINSLGDNFKTVDAIAAVGLSNVKCKANANGMAKLLRDLDYRYSPRMVSGVRQKVWCRPSGK